MTTRKPVTGRPIVALLAAILVAGLLAACGAAQAGREAPAPQKQQAPAQEPATIDSATSAGQTSASEPKAVNGAGGAAGITLPAEARTSEAGGVTVEVTPAGVATDKMLFSLSLNTHSVDLGYDYRALATLRDNQGHTYPAASWEGGSGGHHLQGTLAFDAAPVLQAGAKWVELDLKGIADVPERTFRWELK